MCMNDNLKNYCRHIRKIMVRLIITYIKYMVYQFSKNQDKTLGYQVDKLVQRSIIETLDYVNEQVLNYNKISKF